jgi:predicted nicotinamide N-methyase
VSDAAGAGVNGSDRADLVEEVIAFRDGELTVWRPRDVEALLDEEAFDRDEFMPYWAELWPSGLALARRLAGRALHGARIVELGCGLGIPSLIAARAGGRVLATDWSREALDLLQDNAAANGLALTTELVDWADPITLVGRAPFDLVLAADVLYESRNVELMLKLLPALGSEVWLADPGRSFTDDFIRRASEPYEVHTAREDGPAVHRLLLRERFRTT